MEGNILRGLWKRLERHPGSRGKWIPILPIEKILKSVLLGIAVLVAFSFDPVKAEDPLPEGEGRNLVSEKCQRCHGLDPIQKMRGSIENWSKILEEMTNYGLVLNNKDREMVLKYLETHLGPSPKK